MPTYDGFGPAISRPPNEAITVVSTEPLATRARLFVKLTASDRVAKAHMGDFVDGVVEYAVEYTGDDFADSAVGVAIGGFPFVRIAEDIDAGDRLRPAADGSGYAEKAAPGERAAAIARTSATAASDAPFVRAQLLARPQQVGGALTENALAIGGANDGDLPDLAPSAATLTGALTGVVNGALVDIAATAAATAGGATPTAGQVDAGIATAIASIVTGANEQNKELMAMVNKLTADNVALRASIREIATKVNAIVT